MPLTSQRQHPDVERAESGLATSEWNVSEARHNLIKVLGHEEDIQPMLLLVIIKVHPNTLSAINPCDVG